MDLVLQMHVLVIAQDAIVNALKQSMLAHFRGESVAENSWPSFKACCAWILHAKMTSLS